jgi:DNA-binding transcriptional LysR family regulator
MSSDAGFVPRVRHEVEETSTLVTLVSAGLGVAIAPEPTAALDIAGVRYRPLAPDALGVDLAAARAERANSPLLENVLAVLRQVARAESQPNPMPTDRSMKRISHPAREP